jgi:predicted nucleic acid-binding Zn ribbon protein
MPTYVYKFLETGETVEVQQSFSDDTLTEAVHPRTGATMAVKKVFQPVGVTFKGDGFYKTDSRSSSKTGTASKSETSDGSTGGTSTSSETTGSGNDTKKSADTSTTPSTSGSTSTSSTETKSAGSKGAPTGTSPGKAPSSG